MKTLNKISLSMVLEILSSYAPLYVPAGNETFSGFVRYSAGLEVRLDKNTKLGPKSLLFPKVENIYSYSNHGKDTEIFSDPQENEPTIIFGVRSCDLQAIICLDDVFLNRTSRDGVNDYNYRIRRGNAIIVALGCLEADGDCFCQAMGVNPSEHEQADLQLFDLGEFFGVESHTPKGLNLSRLLENSGLLAEKKVDKPLPASFSLTVDAQGITHKLQKMFDHPLWDELGEKCLNCGVCTYVCPACHCFDISVCAKDGCNGATIRYWDSCMFSRYTEMAGGHNPRPGKKEKVRQRFLHKLRYFPERYGKFLCTGCGRCVELCPVNLDITEVIRRVKEAEIDG
ncbi:anaerobic sulfite reductase subunit A [Peptococcaceae bacterium CEB3]|nr:anaerobic sulfite reductase subunit A [Peptococcaceae bacterium CEB3]